jgi:cytochrome P450
MADYLVEATLDLILRVTIGSYDKQLSNQLLSVLNSQLEHASKTGVVNALFSTLTPLNQIGEKRRARQMYDLLAPKVQQHIDDSKQSDLLNKEKIDVLDWALANHPEFGVSTLIDQIKTFVLAGHDTASSTLAWIYYHLSQQPEVLQRLREEHDNVFAGKDSIGREGGYIAKDPTILNEMKYTLAVMREALRLYPPAAAVRQADSDLYVVEHMGTNYSVAGCMLWVNHWCLHRSKGMYRSALRASYIADLTL